MARNDSAMGKVSTVLLAALILYGVLDAVESVPFKRSHSKSLRLCSKSLTDALYVACHDSGYNDPFLLNADELIVSPSPGLVDECCYHQCSYDQLEHYCKTISGNKQSDSRDVIKESYRIVKLPYSFAKGDLSSSEENPRVEMDYVDDAIKRKVADLKRGSHRGKGGRNDDGECKGNADAKKRHRGKHHRCRRRRLERRRAGKVSRGNVKLLDNKFVTLSTTNKVSSLLSTSTRSAKRDRRN